MELFDNTLILKDYLRLSETSSVVQAVISDQTYYDTIKISGTRNVFTKEFVQSETFKRFWDKLNALITTFIWSGYTFEDTYWNDLRFRHLRNLIVGEDSVLGVIPRKIFQDSKLEKIILDYNINDMDFLNVGFDDPYKLCESLKTLIFVSKTPEIPLKFVEINEMFAHINYKYLDMNEVIFNLKRIPSGDCHENHCYFMEKIELEFIRDDRSSKVIVKPLILLEQSNTCVIFKSEFVTDFLIANFETECLAFYKSCFETFPFIKKIKVSFLTYESFDTFVNLIAKHLKYIEDLQITSQSSFLTYSDQERLFAELPHLQNVEIDSDDSSDDGSEDWSEAFKDTRVVNTGHYLASYC